ncbi:MAG: hypothetical protein CMA04_003005 [Methanobacteriota archaeon]|nr:MAG: hypothetical protein CMA04_005160 [Euryarchaeota archaeon]RAH09568.1 MAG: hypothetical protein CMA04_003005 [Euryarchaeota archaeon]
MQRVVGNGGERVAGFSRLMLWMVLFIGGAGFLTLRGSLSGNGELGAAGGLLILLAYLMFTGGQPAPPVRKKKNTTSISIEEEIEEEIIIPVSRKRGVDVVTPVVEAVDNEDIIEVEALDDDIVEAKEYVVEVDAQSMLETEIDSVVLSRRESQKEIREGIEKRRRKQLAKIRGDTLRSRYDADSREELQKILQQSNEIQVLDEPENPAPGHPYGKVLIRIDENKILRLRVPLDVGLRAAESESEPLPDLGGLPPPPLPKAIGDLPPPPLPGEIGGLPPPPNSDQ